MGYALQKQVKMRKKNGVNKLRAENQLGKVKHYSCEPSRVGAKQQVPQGYNI